MKIRRIMLLITLLFMFSVFYSCASRKVISEEIKAEAERVSFKTLVQQTDRYKGKTVILGGYIIETKNISGVANMTVLQTPLGRDEMPVSHGRSEGGFLLSYNGHLEPEVYQKGRRTTVAGKVVGRVDEGTGNCPSPCVKLEYRQIYLWPVWEEPSYFSDPGQEAGPWFERRPYGY
jgi:outer membrane lipoprotein